MTVTGFRWFREFRFLGRPLRGLVKLWSGQLSGWVIVLCDTRDTSILIVDTYATIPVSPKSQYITWYVIAVKNILRRRKYREYRWYHASRNTEQWAAYASVRCQNERNKVTHSKALCKQQSPSHQVLLHCQSLGSIVIKEGLTPSGQRTRTQISKTSVDLKM